MTLSRGRSWRRRAFVLTAVVLVTLPHGFAQIEKNAEQRTRDFDALPLPAGEWRRHALETTDAVIWLPVDLTAGDDPDSPLFFPSFAFSP